MQKQTCIIDFSGTEIRSGIFTDEQFQTIDLNLPWDIGFRQEDEKLVACFGEELKRIDPNQPNEVSFTTLDIKLKDISDSKALNCLFGTFIEEILHQRLREHGYDIQDMSVYVITPYQWKRTHREHLRKSFKRVCRELPTASFISSNVKLRGLLSQILCLTIFFLKDISNTYSELQLCLIDFTRRNLILNQLCCTETSDSMNVELCDIICLTDYFRDVSISVSELQSIIQRQEDNVPIVVGFSGRIDDDVAETTMRLLQERCTAIYLEPQQIAALLGSAELTQQFEEKTLEKPIHFTHAFCFGVQMPDGRCYELIPKTWTPPYTRKKAFRVSNNEEKFDVYLICGLSVTERSDVHNIATLEIDLTDQNVKDFVLSVSLHSSANGTFAVHLPNSQEQSSMDFSIPVLMD